MHSQWLKCWAHVVPSWPTAVSNIHGPHSMGNEGSCHLGCRLWKKNYNKKSRIKIKFYCFGVKRSAVFTGRGGPTWVVAAFMMYLAASQVVALPPRWPFLVVGQHLGLMCPVLEATSHTSQELWPWDCESPKESVQRLILRHLRNHVVWSRILKWSMKSYVAGSINQMLFQRISFHASHHTW